MRFVLRGFVVGVAQDAGWKTCDTRASETSSCNTGCQPRLIATTTAIKTALHFGFSHSPPQEANDRVPAAQEGIRDAKITSTRFAGEGLLHNTRAHAEPEHRVPSSHVHALSSSVDGVGWAGDR